MASTDPIELNYLVFDDEDEERNQNLLNVKIPGFSCNLLFVNPVEFYNAENDTFDIEAFKSKIIEITRGRHISLVATDWNMMRSCSNYSEVNGLEIIEILLKINEKYRKCPFLVYSGNPNEASAVLIGKIRSEVCIDTNEPIYSLQLLTLLLELKIKFCSRNSRFNEIKTLIKGEKSISLIVMNLLATFDSNLVVNTGNEFYDGRTVGSLVNAISQDNDLGFKFVREFIELSIANYTELNG